MHCFEKTLMRNYLFDLVRELDPIAVRDDLRLDDLLDGHDIVSLAELMALGSAQMIALVREFSGQLPLAA